MVSLILKKRKKGDRTISRPGRWGKNQFPACECMSLKYICPFFAKAKVCFGSNPVCQITLICDFCDSLLENQKQTARLESENPANAKLYYRVRPEPDCQCQQKRFPNEPLLINNQSLRFLSSCNAYQANNTRTEQPDCCWYWYL